jgi:two-component system LytT family sensor kinase
MNKFSLLPSSPRYSFWKVFWVLLAVYVFFFILGISVTVMTPGEGYTWRDFVTAKSLVKCAISVTVTTFFFYVTLNVFNDFFVRKKAAIHFLPMIVSSVVAIFFYHMAMDLFFPPKKPSKEELTTGMMLFASAFVSVFTTGFSLFLAYLNNLRDERKQRKILEEQKMQLEVEKSQANLNFLKAQINPHFLHNTLNFLYAKSLPYSPELSEGILTLSDIMRYALSEGTMKDGKALLKDEIEHVRNVIKINQLRYSNSLTVSFDVNGVVNGATIIPFVLITLVENAFKHGDLKSIEQPIEIHLTVAGKRLEFYCRNKKKTGPKELSTGIGLANIRNRLDLAYGNKYMLQVKDSADIYTTELILTEL